MVNAATGEAAMQATATEHPDLVLLDLGLPGLDGLGVIHALRGWTKVPIIVLTARDDERSKVEALDAGADDYVTKPFGMAELLARINAALRRSSEGHVAEPEVTTPWLRLDLAGHRAFTGPAHDHEVHLTGTEWQIVGYLVRNAGRLVTHRPARRRRVGAELLAQPQPATGAHGQHPPQARAAPRRTRPLHHRHRSRLPLRNRSPPPSDPTAAWSTSRTQRRPPIPTFASGIVAAISACVRVDRGHGVERCRVRVSGA